MAESVASWLARYASSIVAGLGSQARCVARRAWPKGWSLRIGRGALGRSVARWQRDWPQLERLARVGSATEPGCAVDRVEALVRQHRYGACVRAFRRDCRWCLDDPEADPSGAARAVAAAIVSLRRSGCEAEARRLLHELPRVLRRHWLVVRAGHDVLVRHSPRAAITLLEGARVPAAARRSVRRLGALSVARAHAGDSAASVLAAFETEAEAAGLDARTAGFGVLSAALAARAGRHDVAWRSVNAELGRVGLAPLDVPKPAGPIRTDTLSVSAGDSLPARRELVTVIMSAYRAEASIDRAIASVLAQSHERLELIVVDDASDDATGDRVLAWRSRDARVRLLRRQANGGPYTCRNMALAEAQGHYVTTHDADDWAHPHRLRWQLHALRRHGALGCVTGWVRLAADGQLGLRDDGTLLHEDLSSFVYDRRVFDALGGFDEVRVSADTEFRSRVLARFGRAALVRADDVLAAFGSLHAASLTRAGGVAYDEFGFNLQRAAYWCAARAWHERCRRAGKTPMLIPGGPRPFAAPAPVTARAGNDPGGNDPGGNDPGGHGPGACGTKERRT